MTHTSLVELDSVTKRYSLSNNGALTAIKDVTLRVDRGDFIVIVGPNGSGKTTLFDVITGAVPVDDGSLKYCGENDRAAINIARVRQTPSDGIFGDLTVRENLRVFSLQGLPSPFRLRAASGALSESISILSSYGLADKLEQRASELSEGQRQLLALILAMSRQPAVLLLDEHTASLDQENADKCMEATVKLSSSTAGAVMMITHNLSHALNYGTSLVVLRDGQIKERIDGDDKKSLSMNGLLRHCGYELE